MTVTYGGTAYHYAANLQGDVVAILNGSGTAVVSYTYDAWGNVLSTTGSLASTLGTHNPLRYRGYVYDIETGLYYLQSRYYDPSLGRFINADSYVSTGQGILGNNMFAYCRNNPVSRKDASGTDDVSCTTEEDNDPFNDLGKAPGQGSGGGAGGNGTITVGNCTYSNYVGSSSNAYTTATSSSQTGNYNSPVGHSTNSITSTADYNISNIQYTPKVEAQMANTNDLYHAFPSAIDQFIPYGDAITIIGGDGIARTRITLHGSINGIDGFYEYIFEPDGICNHRLFKQFE